VNKLNFGTKKTLKNDKSYFQELGMQKPEFVFMAQIQPLKHSQILKGLAHLWAVRNNEKHLLIWFQLCALTQEANYLQIQVIYKWFYWAIVNKNITTQSRSPAKSAGWDRQKTAAPYFSRYNS